MKIGKRLALSAPLIWNQFMGCSLRNQFWKREFSFKRVKKVFF